MDVRRAGSEGGIEVQRRVRGIRFGCRTLGHFEGDLTNILIASNLWRLTLKFFFECCGNLHQSVGRMCVVSRHAGSHRPS